MNDIEAQSKESAGFGEKILENQDIKPVGKDSAEIEMKIYRANQKNKAVEKSKMNNEKENK